MLKSVLSIIAILSLSPAAFANNPDAGQLARIVCYGVTQPGNIDSRDHNFTIVIEQADVQPLDASYFVPGNSNYNRKYPPAIDFNIYVFKNSTALSQAEDHVTLADELLSSNTVEPHFGEGARRRTNVGFWLDQTGDLGSVSIRGNNPAASGYHNNEDQEDRAILCEEPYSVPVPQSALKG